MGRLHTSWQATAAAFDETELKDGFKAVVELFFVRMQRGICDEDVKLRSLQREEMVKVIGIVKLVRYLRQKYQFKGKHDKQIMSPFASSLSWHDSPGPCNEVMMVCSQSAKNMHSFITALYEGKWDYVFAEIAEESITKRRSGASYAEHGKFHVADDIDTPFRREATQQQNAARYAASDSQPVELEVLEDLAEDGDEGRGDAASSQPAVDISDGEMDCTDDSGDKEKKLKEARATHVQRALDDTIRFVERPSLKAGYVALFQESLMIQRRSTLRRAGKENTDWRHGWFYDCCADQEPKITEQCKKAVNSVSPQPDTPVSKMFFESCLTVATDNDVLLAPNARSNGATQVLKKHLEKTTHSEALNLVYKEYPGRGRQKLTETIHAGSTKPFGLQPAEARMHYHLTTTSSDAIVQVMDAEEPLQVEVQQKEGILGREMLFTHEKMLKPTDKTVLFHWEKRLEVYEEIFHHFHLSSITTASCGRLPMLQACLRLNIKCLALYRNQTHLKLLKEDLLAWMTTESEHNPVCLYYLKREDLIEQLGLDADVAVGSHVAGLGGASSVAEEEDPAEKGEEGENNEEEPEEEEDQEEEEEEEAHEEEEEEENKEEDPEEEAGQPPRKRPKAEAKPKAKGKAKAEAKPKAKGKAKAEAKGKAKAEPKPKAKGKSKSKAKAKGQEEQG